METIGIIAAMPQESNALLHFITKRKHLTLGPFRGERFQIQERDCWLLTSGMGVKRAVQAARNLIDAAHPQLLVSVGVAGAVYADLEIGDVVISRNSCLLGQGLPGQFQPLALLSAGARQAAFQALQARRAGIYDGTAITTPGSQFFEHQPGEIDNPILEMETAGIAQVTAETHIPLLSLRALSDGPRAPIPFDLEAVMDEEYNLRMGAIIKMILCHPQIIPRLMRMGRNTKMAAQNAALVLISALSQPGPLISP